MTFFIYCPPRHQPESFYWRPFGQAASSFLTEQLSVLMRLICTGWNASAGTRSLGQWI